MLTDPRILITAIRDRTEIAPQDLRDWVLAMGAAQSPISDSQCAAFAMAVLCRRLPDDLRSTLTLAMRDSGEVLEWEEGPPVVDKHSTGGIGDATSFIIAPVLAALGARVPMISGRGLGHTGGTLDKIEAFADLNVDLEPHHFKSTVNEVGCAIVSASPRLAPSDRRLYALRDHVGAVPSIDLITSSILSKKLAEGISALVLDVKFGAGGFLPTAQDAHDLAQIMCRTASEAGVKTQALITDMNAPLAQAVGHATELRAVAAILNGTDKSSFLYRVSLALSARLAVAAGLFADETAARVQVQEVLENGAARSRFEAMVIAQGGPKNAISNADQILPNAPYTTEIQAPRGGYIAGVDGLTLAEVLFDLGGMRKNPTDQIDLAVGFEGIIERGAAVHIGQPLCTVQSQTPLRAEQLAKVAAAFTLSSAPVPFDLITAQVL